MDGDDCGFRELLGGDGWRTLTVDREKLALYRDDEHFRRGLACADEVIGAPVGAALQRHAVLIIQPDCIAGRSAGRCVEFVRGHGFEPVHSVRFRFGPDKVAAIWHYQSNAATQDSLDLADVICGKGDSLLVLLRDTTPDPTLPASLRLANVKGRSNPASRTSSQLRTVLSAPTLLVVLVHSPDEPIDVIRETAVLCGDDLPDLYARMQASVPGDAARVLDEQIEQLERESEPHDLSLDAAWQRLTTRLESTGDGGELLASLEKVRAGVAKLSWRDFARDLSAVGIDPLDWDPVIVASEHIEYDLDEVPRLIDRVDTDAWLSGAGLLLTAERRA